MKLLFTKYEQPIALEVLGYILCIIIGFTNIMINPLCWQNYVYSILGVILFGTLYRIFVAHTDMVVAFIKKAYETLTTFLCRLAGKVASDLTKSERIRYGVLGMTLFIPFGLATYTFPYLLQTSFDVSPTVSYIAAIPFVLLIFWVDRSFVTTMGYQKKATVFLTRFFLAGVLGWLLAQPIELQLFNKEIKEELTVQKSQKLNALEKERLGMDKTLDAKEIEAKKELNRARAEYEQEINTSIAGRPAGHGPEAKKKLEYYNQQLADYNTNIAPGLVAERKANDSTYAARKVEYQKTQSYGLGAQLQALGSASKKYEDIFWYHWIIILSLLTLDLAPLLAKFLMPKSASDRKEEDEDIHAENALEQKKIKYKYDLIKAELKCATSIIHSLKLTKEAKDKLIIQEKNRITRKYLGEQAVIQLNSTATKSAS